MPPESLIKPRVVFLGSPQSVVPVLQQLVSLDSTGFIELVGVVSQPAKRGKRGKEKHDPVVAAFAKNLGEKKPHLAVLQPDRANSPEFLQEFANLRPDIAITAAYGQILTDAFLAIPSRATINVHPSLLPAYRGATPVQSALMDAIQESGVSILFTVRELDAGNLITQKRVSLSGDPVHKGAVYWMDELFQVGAQMIPDAILQLADTAFVGTPQAQNPMGVEPSHCSKLRKSQGKLDWSDTASNLAALSRGLEIWPGCYGFVMGSAFEKSSDLKPVKVAFGELSPLGALPADVKVTSLQPGEAAYSKSLKGAVVGCGQGQFISIARFKPAGSKEVTARDFFNRIPCGSASFLTARIPVIVGVSGTGRSLRNLLRLESEKLWNICGVFSNKPDCKAIRYAKRCGIPTWVGDATSESAKLQTFILDQTKGSPGVVCLAGFLQKFPAIELGNVKAINIHPSLLPMFGGKGMYGAHVHEAVLKSKQKKSGATVHLVTDQYDNGEVLGQKEVDVSACQSSDEIAAAVFELEKKLLPEVLDTLTLGFLKGTKVGTDL